MSTYTPEQQRQLDIESGAELDRQAARNLSLRPSERLVLEQLRVLRQSLLAMDAEMADDEALLLGTLEGETDVLEQLRHTVRVALQAEDWAEAIRARERVMKTRRGRLEAKAERCRDFVKEALATLGLKSLVADDFSASVRPGQPSLQIDLAKLPDAYKRIIEEAEKALIRAALNQGKEVSGAEFGNAAPVLTIRTN